MIICATPTPEQIKAMQALAASHASAGSFGAIVGFVSHSMPVYATKSNT
jgi:hypothetical protein